MKVFNRIILYSVTTLFFVVIFTSSNIKDVHAITNGYNYVSAIYNINEKTQTAEITGIKTSDLYPGDLGDTGLVRIPKSTKIDGKEYKVTTIKSGAFQNKDIVSVEIPETIWSIEDYAFSDNRRLDTVTFKDTESVSNGLYLGPKSFSNTPSLRSIKLPKRTSKISYQFFTSGFTNIFFSSYNQNLNLTDSDKINFSESKLAKIYVPGEFVNEFKLIFDKKFSNYIQDSNDRLILDSNYKIVSDRTIDTGLIINNQDLIVNFIYRAKRTDTNILTSIEIVPIKHIDGITFEATGYISVALLDTLTYDFGYPSRLRGGNQSMDKGRYLYTDIQTKIPNRFYGTYFLTDKETEISVNITVYINNKQYSFPVREVKDVWFE